MTRIIVTSSAYARARTLSTAVAAVGDAVRPVADDEPVELARALALLRHALARSTVVARRTNDVTNARLTRVL